MLKLMPLFAPPTKAVELAEALLPPLLLPPVTVPLLEPNEIVVALALGVAEAELVATVLMPVAETEPVQVTLPVYGAVWLAPTMASVSLLMGK